MATKRRHSGTASQTQRQREQAARSAAAEQNRRAENARKSRQLSNAFLFVFLGMIGAVCLYVTGKTFFFPAASVQELRSSYLFVSLFALPYLMAAAAILLRAALKKRVENFSSAGKRGAGILFFAVLIAAFALFGLQLRGGTEQADRQPAYTAFTEALEASGSSAATLTGASAQRSVLERMSLSADAVCGTCTVSMQYHDASFGIADRFPRQVQRDCAGVEPLEEVSDGIRILTWQPRGSSAALALSCGSQCAVFELRGPDAETEALLPLLREAFRKLLR